MGYSLLKFKHIVFFVILLFFSYWMTTHYSIGYFSEDDSTYHFMIKSFCDNKKLNLQNGYEQFPSLELSLNTPLNNTKTVNNGKLFIKIAPLYAFVAAPFYFLLKTKGLVFLNVISFLISFYFIYMIAFKIFKDKNIAINSCFFLLVGSYIYEYAIGIWPHVLNLGSSPN